MDKSILAKILASHEKWLHDNPEGQKADLIKAYLRGADLRGADLHGANLSGADLSGADLRGADLREASLNRTNLCKANLRKADLRKADLREASLRSADLRKADLRKAYLRRTNLCGADLNKAILPNLDIPIIENIDKQIFEAISRPENKLEMKTWHTCETTHCRAGWAIHLAGEKGYALEQSLGAVTAGALIYAKSRPNKRVPDFNGSNETAWQSICDDAGIIKTAQNQETSNE